MNLIETKNLTQNGRVNHLQLQIPTHSIYGFLGENGAGKTTTLKLLLGLIHPDEGNIYYNREELTPKNKYRLLRQTGSLIESPSYYGHLTAFENLAILAKLKKCSIAQIDEVLHLVRLYERRNEKVKHYSLGMKQRLGLAMALLGSPKILILDEPTNGLDPSGIQEFRELIRSLPEKMDMTVILSSHLLSEIEQMATHVGIISHGEMAYQGALSALDPEGHRLEDIFLRLTQAPADL